MHRANRISVCCLVLGFWTWFNLCWAESAHPIVPGYDRFHSQQPSAEGGRILFNELGCVNCHSNATDLPHRKGPLLSGISNRLNLSWISSFLKKPSSQKPGTTMPDFDFEDDEIEAITHYLASLKGPKAKKAFKFVNARRGHELYHKVGCVACHLPGSNSDSSISDMPPSPYPDLKAKYDIHSLSAFLFEPHATRPHGRMPKFPLEREDGGDLAAYLLDYANGDSSDYLPLDNSKADGALSALGRDLVVKHNCLACHEFPQTEQLPIVRKSRLQPDFVIPTQHPSYSLTEHQLESIRLFVGNKRRRATATNVLETLNCLACHDRDGKGGPTKTSLDFFSGNPDLGDAGRIPPSLAKIGDKLQDNWLEKAIEGHVSVRLYLNTKMPHFGEPSQSLAKLLRQDDRRKRSSRLPSGDIDAGQILLGSDGGLNCITCHRWEDRESLGIKGLDLSNLAERLNKDWLYEFLIDPATKQPNTLMPSFWPLGKASNQQILGGNTKAQIASIYAFTQSGKEYPHGYPEIGTAAFEIVPEDRPVVQRTFMESIGTDALLVGFPQRLHYAVDGKTGRPALMWKGRFFDAYRTWFSRFPEFEKPLGSDIVAWPQMDTEFNASYKGYRIDETGSPIFISEYLGTVLYDQLQPVEQPNGSLAIKRTIRYTQERQSEDSLLSHPMGVEVTSLPTDKALTRIFLYQW